MWAFLVGYFAVIDWIAVLRGDKRLSWTACGFMAWTWAYAAYYGLF